MSDVIFLGYHDPDKKRTPLQKLTNACDRFREKFGIEPDTALVSPREALALAGLDTNGVRIEGQSSIAVDVMYVGRAGAREPVTT